MLDTHTAPLRRGFSLVDFDCRSIAILTMVVPCDRVCLASCMRDICLHDSLDAGNGKVRALRRTVGLRISRITGL